MGSQSDRPASPPPGLGAIFLCFAAIGAQSFGGGLSAWIRREVVIKRRWIEDGAFLSGLALSQIAPGANAVNQAVFIGTALRGVAGAMAALGGLMAVPVLAVLAAGTLYLRVVETGPPALAAQVAAALTGMGAAAIGLTLANGWRLSRGRVGLAHPGPLLVAAATALLIGYWRLPLLAMLPVLAAASFLATRAPRR